MGSSDPAAASSRAGLARARRMHSNVRTVRTTPHRVRIVRTESERLPMSESLVPLFLDADGDTWSSLDGGSIVLVPASTLEALENGETRARDLRGVVGISLATFWPRERTPMEAAE